MNLSAIKYYFKIFRRFFKLSFLTQSAFRFNFFFGYLIDIGWLLFSLAFFQVFYLNIDHIAGWNYGQMLVLLGTYWIYQVIIYAVVVIHNLRRLPKIVWTGYLDLILVKPISSQFFVSTQTIWVASFLNLVPALLFLNRGFSILGQSPSITNIFYYLIMLASGLIIVYSLWFMITTLVFFIDRADNLPYLPQALIDQITQYPLDIFKEKTRFLLTFVVPLAFVATLPAKIILGQLGKIYIFIAIGLAVIFLYFSHVFWQFSLRRYTSASS